MRVFSWSGWQFEMHLSCKNSLNILLILIEFKHVYKAPSFYNKPYVNYENPAVQQDSLVKTIWVI